MNSAQTLGQTEGLGQMRKWKLGKTKNQTEKTRTYPPTGQGKWSSSVADPSIPPVLRGQQHGPWGSRKLVGKCRWWWFGIGWVRKGIRSRNWKLSQKILFKLMEGWILCFTIFGRKPILTLNINQRSSDGA